ncbi:MAG TPA: enoyl-CoA hydratase-related protein [Candidatus Binataceae bacterium]
MSESGQYRNILFERDGRVGLLTINRPAVHNAISLETIAELSSLLGRLEQDDTLGAVILTGAGDKTFVSGGDLTDFDRLRTIEAAAQMSRDMQSMTARLNRLPTPVIGAINGDCIGGGCEVALACDMRIASKRARFGFKQVAIGITPAWGARNRLLGLVGRSQTLRLLLAGDVIDAEQALRIGIVDEVVEPAEVAVAARKLADTIVSNAPLATRAIKRAVDEGAQMSGAEAIEFEAQVFARTWVSEDHWEALAAMREKRAPRYRGR